MTVGRQLAFALYTCNFFQYRVGPTGIHYIQRRLAVDAAWNFLGISRAGDPRTRILETLMFNRPSVFTVPIPPTVMRKLLSTPVPLVTIRKAFGTGLKSTPNPAL